MAAVLAPAAILVVDNDEITVRYLKRLLTREGHHVSVVASAEEVIASCLSRPPDLVLLDLATAAGKGVGVCSELKDHSATRLIPVVVIATQTDGRERLDAIQAGCDEFITKPFDAAELHARIRSLVRLKRYTDDLESAEAVFLGLGATIEARDPSTQGHCERLARYATTLGRSLNLDQADLDALERGSFLHDIGKIAVPDSVLLKGGALDAQELGVMREHPVVGDALCAGLRSLQRVRPIVRHHHERLDGSGYPDGLRNAQVPLLAQIVAIVDVFDALTTERPYRAALPRDAAVTVLMDETSKGWRDRALVDEFASLV